MKPKDQSHPPTPTVASHIWMGPTIPRLGIRRNMVIKGRVAPVQLRNIIETKPMLGSLFVPTEKITAVKASLKVRGSIHHMAAEYIKEYNQTTITKKEI